MLRCEGVGLDYGERVIIDKVSFTVERGEFVALLGENGAGKSTLCRLCNGLIKPQRGRVLLAGQDTRQVKASALSRRVGYLFQNPDRQLCKNTVAEEILFGLDFVLEAAGVAPGVALDGMSPAHKEGEKKRRLQEMLELFQLDGGRDPFGLSRGERQQVALAGVLARKPEFLILDEPTTGLDYRECSAIMDIIAGLNAAGTTILMISHDMEVVTDYARRALVLSRGRLVADAPVRRIMADRALLEQASLLPAQIPHLAQLVGPPLAGVFTVEEMLARCAEARRGDEGARL
ncbi:MAG: energy-coupling factor ABC transporter ATP-binding protein [Treponema sp.]|jgi:energy-coupling factor transport system ATP-binding protein|nr:energy-coupling factor ABC transporter ATP-binding protein [Treponema sp.]